jgi:polar amino acid transport system substrate-binding protein
MTLRGLALSLIALLMTLPSVAAPKVLHIATGEFPPYATEQRADKGIALHIVRRAFELAGYQVEYTFLPWSRTLAEARTGKWDGTAYWGHKPEHEAYFLMSDNVLTEQWVFIHRADVRFAWETLDDLKPHRVGVIQDYTYTPELWAKANSGAFRVERLPNDQAALKMLLLGRIDVTPMERNVACDLLRTHHSEAESAKLAANQKLMTENFTTHLMLPRARIESAARLSDFNAGLKKMRATGEYASVLEQVDCPKAWQTKIVKK